MFHFFAGKYNFGKRSPDWKQTTCDALQDMVTPVADCRQRQPLSGCTANFWHGSLSAKLPIWPTLAGHEYSITWPRNE